MASAIVPPRPIPRPYPRRKDAFDYVLHEYGEREPRWLYADASRVAFSQETIWRSAYSRWTASVRNVAKVVASFLF